MALDFVANATVDMLLGHIASNPFGFNDSNLELNSTGLGTTDGVPGRPPKPPMPPMPPSHASRDQIKTAHFICVGIIIPLGFILNTMSFVVFATSKILRQTTTGHYLIALAVADSMFLSGEFFRWLNTPHIGHIGINVQFMDNSNALCKMVFCLRYVSKLLSAWITVIITLERFLTVAFPLKVSRISTPKIAKVTIASTCLVSLLGGSFPLWTVGVFMWGPRLRCLIIQESHISKVYNICNWIILRVGSLFLPGILIIIFCVLIAVNLRKAKHTRIRRLSTTSACSGGPRRSQHRLERQLTVMLLAVATAFIVLRLPYTIAYYLYQYPVSTASRHQENTYAAFKIADIFVSVNYAINFFLYCFCGSSFRKQLKMLCRTRRPSLIRSWSNETTTSTIAFRNGSLRTDGKYRVEMSTNGKITATEPYADHRL